VGSIATTGAPLFLINGEALRREASRHRLYTDHAIADALGCNRSTLSRVLAGKYRPSNELLAAIAVRFGDAAYRRIVHRVK